MTYTITRRMALELWKQRLGNKATYKELIAAFGRVNRQDYAAFVSDIFGINNLILHSCLYESVRSKVPNNLATSHACPCIA